MALFGTSTSALKEKSRFDLLLGFEPQVIEFYNYPSRDLVRIADFCREHGTVLALHTPTPYDEPEPLRRFAPTGPDPVEFRRALELTLGTIRAAAKLDALHVVVHFPTPYADAGPVIEQDAIDAFMAPVAEEARALDVRLLVENLSSHPSFHRPEDYEALLERYDNIEFCLDLGHAAQLEQEDPIAEFASRLGTRIRSAHVYNRRPGTGHVPVGPDQSTDDGWIDIVDAVSRLSRHCDIASWILEPDSLQGDDLAGAQDGGRWLRGVLGSIAPGG